MASGPAAYGSAQQSRETAQVGRHRPRGLRFHGAVAAQRLPARLGQPSASTAITAGQSLDQRAPEHRFMYFDRQPRAPIRHARTPARGRGDRAVYRPIACSRSALPGADCDDGADEDAYLGNQSDHDSNGGSSAVRGRSAAACGLRAGRGISIVQSTGTCRLPVRRCPVQALRDSTSAKFPWTPTHRAIPHAEAGPHRYPSAKRSATG